MKSVVRKLKWSRTSVANGNQYVSHEHEESLVKILNFFLFFPPGGCKEELGFNLDHLFSHIFKKDNYLHTVGPIYEVGQVLNLTGVVVHPTQLNKQYEVLGLLRNF